MASNQDAAHNMGLLLLRVFIGLVLLTNGWAGVRNHEPKPSELSQIVKTAAVEAPSLVRWIGQDLVAEQAEVFAVFIRWGSLIAGVLFLLGALVRPVGWIAGGVFMLAFFLGRPSQEQLHLIAAATCVACALTSAGCFMGMDTMLDKLLPTWLTWGKQSFGSRNSPFA